MKRIAFILIFLVVFAFVAGDAVWRGTSNTIIRLLKGDVGEAADQMLPQESLPEPVARFFAHTLPADRKPVRAAELTQEGEFLLNGSWKSMTAEQYITTGRPSFIWDARIRLAPLLHVYVRDTYITGHGSMRARVAGVYPVADAHNNAALDTGALMRYLGEAVWLPTRLLPGHGLSWAAVDDNRADATFTDNGVGVTLRFTFTQDGDVAQIEAAARPREVEGRYVPTPWRVRALGYEVVNGQRIMSPAEAEWILPEGPQAYWRARITRLTYTY